jgi:hypothetical protein
MRYPAAEKAEIIRLVEQSHLPARRSLLGTAPQKRFMAIAGSGINILLTISPKKTTMVNGGLSHFAG